MLTAGLRTYQPPIVRQLLEILKRNGAALDASETGVGKTYSGMAVARELGIKPLVVCPKIVRPNWHGVAAHLGGECFTLNYESLRSGLTEWGCMTKPIGYDTVRQEFEALKEEIKALEPGAGEIVSLSNRLEKARKHFNRLKAQIRYEWAKIPLLFFDEVQRCKGQQMRDTLNSTMLIAAKRQGIPTLLMSATPAQTPLDMKASGYALGLHRGTDFYNWCLKNGCKPGFFAPLEFRGGDAALAKLHRSIFPERGIKITRESLGAEFPESQITVELYDLEKQAFSIDKLYAAVEKQVAALRAKASGDVDLDHPLTQNLRERQEIELIKVPLFVSLIEEHLEAGMSVAVFVNFKETMNAIIEAMPPDYYIPTVEGGQSPEFREIGIANFQSGKGRLILLNTQAGGTGVSLHDTTGLHPRVSLISPCYSALDLIQVFGRVWRNGGGKSLQKIVLAAGTVEQKIHKKLSQKLNNISLITDGDLSTLL